MSAEKIIITGTGKAGTTFLIHLLTLLGFDTGLSVNNKLDNKSGLEKGVNSQELVLKNPGFMLCIPEINKKIRKVIIPVRDYTEAAKSRETARTGGGFWCAKTVDEQITFYKNIIADYVRHMVDYDIDTTFLDFERMVTSPEYLYEKLNDILLEKDISFERFVKEYDTCNDIYG